MDQSETPNDNGTKRDKEDIEPKPVASKALVNVRLPKVFTPKLIESIQNIQSNYAGIQSSFAGVMANVQVPKMFDPELDNFMENIGTLRNSTFEEIEPLNVSAKDPRQIFPGSTLKIEKLGELKRLDNEILTAYEIAGFEFNYEAYRFLSNLETYLRYLITKKIIEPYERNLESKIPRDVLSRWEERKSCDTSDEYDLIYYSDFTDLKIIFEKGRNKDLFNDIFSNEEYKALITKLHELDPIRKKIAHSRPLTEIEFTRLVLYYNDIFIIIKERHS